MKEKWKKRMKGLWQAKRLPIIAVGIVLVIVLAAGGVLVTSKAMTGDWLGFFTKPEGEGSVHVESPSQGAAVKPGTVFSGSYEGGGTVVMWVEGVNFAVPVEASGGSWSYEYAGGLVGDERLGFSVIQDGKWGEATTHTYSFVNEDGSGATEYWSDDAPAPLRKVFRPVEKAVRSVVAFVSTGISGRESGDLDSNGVPDRWQGNPVSPQASWPYGYTMVAIGGVLVVAVLAVLAVRSKPVQAYLVQRREYRFKEAALKADVEKAKLEAAQKLQHRALIERADLSRRQLAAQERALKERLRAERSK